MTPSSLRTWMNSLLSRTPFPFLSWRLSFKIPKRPLNQDERKRNVPEETLEINKAINALLLEFHFNRLDDFHWRRAINREDWVHIGFVP